MKSQRSVHIIDEELNPSFTTINSNIIRDFNKEYDTRDLIGCELNCKCVDTDKHIDSNSNIQTNGEYSCEGCECSHNRCGVYSNYDTNGLLINWQKPIYECGLNCFCNTSTQLRSKCLNRITQYNSCLRQSLTQVFYHHLKGYSVRALNDIKFGQFIGEYCGEVIDRSEAFNRFKCCEHNKQKHNYILIFREHFGSESTFETIIDATHYGNDCRLINHSCDPNLIALPVRSDSLRPRICLFAAKDILKGCELSYNYGSNQSLLSSKSCFCESQNCKRFMPSDLGQ